VAQVITSVVLGGGGQVMSALARNIDRTAFEMDVYCVIEGGELVNYIRSLGFRVEVLPICRSRGPVRYDPAGWARLAARLRCGAYDVVHTHLFRADLVGTVAARVARRPVVVKTLHNMGTRKRRYHRIVDALINAMTDRIVCVSASQREVTIGHDRVQPEKVITIRNGVCMERFELAVERERIAASLGLDASRPIVGTVGRLIIEKGHRYLLEAVPEISRRVPGVQFVIVGDGDLRAQLECQLREMGVSSFVITGLRADIPELLGLMDVFVFPSLSEGSPIAVLEAMAAGVPVSCSDIPALKEIVRHGETCDMFRAADTAQLTDSVCRLLRDAALRASLSSRARAMVRSDYSEAAMARAYEDLYRSEFSRAAGR